jgi:GNAT superfamily N-acetyltransferase
MSSQCEIKEIPLYEFELGLKTGEEFAMSVDSLGDKPDIQHIKKVFKIFYDNNMAIALGVWDPELNEYVGILLAVLIEDLFSGLLTAQEVVWFVRKTHRGHGVKLFKRFEQWAHDCGCKYIAVSHLQNSMPALVGRFYENMGYYKVDVVYRKGI